MLKPGLLLVNKPAGFTSHDVVAKARKILGTRKIGHAGTLDPMATGLLVLGVESGTKLLTFVVGKDKTYEATIRLGASTVTDDIEGEVIFRAEPTALGEVTDDLIKAEVMKLTGELEQIPSSVSAIKVAGVRAYDLVRSGEQVELKSRKVSVSRFQIVGPIRRSQDHIEFEAIIDCSSGTYIRALARDLGNSLNIGGHLIKLNRSNIGDFELSNACQLDQLTDEDIIGMIAATAGLMPIAEISNQQVTDIRHGKKITLEVSGITGLVGKSQLVAIVEPVGSNQAKSLVVFNEVGND